MVIVPDQTKSHAFTLNEMVGATDNFTIKIGQGGFGSVFFGKLPEGKDIAIKVLSLFSKQGVDEFLNEAILRYLNHVQLFNLKAINLSSISATNLRKSNYIDNGFP